MGHKEQECRNGTGKEKLPKHDRRPLKDKEGYQLVVRKQYVVKQKLSTQEHQAPTTMDNPSTSSSPRRIYNHDGNHQHSDVTTPNPFDTLVNENDETTGEETTILKLPIKALGAYPIDVNE